MQHHQLLFLLVSLLLVGTFASPDILTDISGLLGGLSKQTRPQEPEVRTTTQVRTIGKYERLGGSVGRTVDILLES